MAKLSFYSFIESFSFSFDLSVHVSHSEIHSILRKENIIFVVFLIFLLKWCVTEAVLVRSGNGIPCTAVRENFTQVTSLYCRLNSM